MVIKTDGIVLRNTRYGDQVQLVAIYTREAGIQTFSFRRKLSGTGISALLAPMSVITLVADIRHNRKIHYPKEITLAAQLPNIPGDPVKGCLLLFFNELFLKVLKEEESNPPLFDFLVGALKLLDGQKPLHPSFHLSFLVHLAGFLGFFPGNGDFGPDSCFDLREGHFVRQPVGHPEYLGHDLSAVLNELIGVPFEQYQSFRSEKTSRNQLLDALVTFYHLHTAGFGEMKSLAVIRSLFD